MIHDNQPGLEKSSGIASMGHFENGVECSALFFENQNQDLPQRANRSRHLSICLKRPFHELQNKVGQAVA
jgi:hypothetical protein